MEYDEPAPAAGPTSPRDHALSIASATHLHKQGHIPAAHKNRIHKVARTALAKSKKQTAATFGSLAPRMPAQGAGHYMGTMPEE